MNRVRADVGVHLGMRVEQPADLRPARDATGPPSSDVPIRPCDETGSGRAAAKFSRLIDRQLTIGNGHHRSIQRPDTRRTNADVFDRAKELARPAHIPDVDRLVRNHHDAAEQVLNRFLGAEANRQAADAQPGERGREIDVRKIEENQHRDDHRRRLQTGG